MTAVTPHTRAAVADPFLAAKAAAIRALGKRVVRDVIEIGLHLTEAKAACRHGEWLPWLEREFAWKEQTARNFMAAYALVGKSPKFGDLNASENPAKSELRGWNLRHETRECADPDCERSGLPRRLP